MADFRSFIDRRRFLSRFIGATAGLVSVVLAAPLVTYFLSPVLRRKKQQVQVSLIDAANVPVGNPLFATYRETVQDGWVTSERSQGVWVVTKDGTSFAVFDPKCTHLECLYAWNPGLKQFQCACHASVFDIDGNVLSGPAPRPLDRIPFEIREGKIVLTVTQT